MYLRGRHGLIFVLYILCALPLQESVSSVLQSLSVAGTSAVSRGEVLSWLSSAPFSVYSDTLLHADLRRIIENYRLRGYLGATASLAAVEYSDDSAFVDVTIGVKEGRQTVVGTVSLAGVAGPERPDPGSVMETRPGDPLNNALLERDIRAILAYYDTRGYPFASCAVEQLSMRPGDQVDSVDVVIRIAPGERMTIDEIRVEGVRDTKPAVVAREARVVPGEPYDPGRIQAIRQHLVRLNIFSAVEEPQLYMRNGRGGVLIKVQEGSPNTFDGIIGYVPSSVPGESGYLTGLASVSMRNLFGTGRKLAVRWQKENRGSQEIGVRYTEPWILGTPINAGGGFFQRQQDTAYVSRTIDARAELMVSDALVLALFYRSDKVIPSAESPAIRALRSSTSSVGGELLYDTRDDPYAPSSGARYRTDYSYGRRKVPATVAEPASDAPLQRFDVDLDFFVPVFRRHVVALGMHGHEVRGARLGESEMYRFGGTNSLRGYLENQFLGSRVVWANTEYRVPLARRSFLAAFIDLGYYSRGADADRGISGIDAFKYGYGIGVRMETPLGNLGVSFALGQGDSFGTGKVHVGLINEF